MEDNQEQKSSGWLIYALIGCSVISILCSFYFFYFKKDYEFLVEVPCDITQEQCFQRDCTNPDDCPVNGLADFKRYSLSAADFAMCENEECEEACETGIIECEQVECEENLDIGESCSFLPSPAEPEPTE